MYCTQHTCNCIAADSKDDKGIDELIKRSLEELFRYNFRNGTGFRVVVVVPLLNVPHVLVVVEIIVSS
jgi:hypothetical protein